MLKLQDKSEANSSKDNSTIVYRNINYSEVQRSSDISQALLKGANKQSAVSSASDDKPRDSTMLSGNDVSQSDQPSFGRFTTFKQ
jgi:hypothetical protein